MLVQGLNLLRDPGCLDPVGRGGAVVSGANTVLFSGVGDV